MAAATPRGAAAEASSAAAAAAAAAVVAQGDAPLLALLRAEYLAWHQRRFALAVADVWPLPGDSKTLRWCRAEGLLAGLQGAHARFLFGQLQAQSAPVDPLLPHAPDVPDRDTTKELTAAGLAPAAAEAMSAMLAAAMGDASARVAAVRAELAASAGAGAALPAHGRVRVLWPPWRPGSRGGAAGGAGGGGAPSFPAAPPQQVLLVFTPDPAAVERWLRPVRDDAPLPPGREDLFGAPVLPLSAAARKPAVAARLAAAGVPLGPFTAVLELNEAHYVKLCALLALKASGKGGAAGAQGKGGDGGDSEGGGGAPAPPPPPAPPPELAPHLRPVLSPSDDLARALFCVLARYETLSGNTGGIQGAVPHHAFDALQRELGVAHECFASPLNCHFPSYCSAFADTDGPFGGTGSFFDFRPRSGSFEVNPPFVNTTMLAAARHVEELLAAAAAEGEALLFFVIVPAWRDARFHTLLAGSRFTRVARTAREREHCYIDGLQHRADRTAWDANVDSTWFVLATDAAAERYALGPATEARLAAAIAASVECDAPGRVFQYLLPPLRGGGGAGGGADAWGGGSPRSPAGDSGGGGGGEDRWGAPSPGRPGSAASGWGSGGGSGSWRAGGGSWGGGAAPSPRAGGFGGGATAGAGAWSPARDGDRWR